MGAVGSRFIERASWLLQLPLETPTIRYEDEASGCTLWLKLDYLLPSGCTKDRMATNIVAHAIASGEVSPSTVVVEASSGSTSIALSMVCATVGVQFRAYMPKTVSGERVLMIRRLGGDVVLTPAEQGMDGAIAALLGDSGTQADVYAARQFENPRNVFAHRHSTGPELIQQVGGRLDGFVAGVGTGGTLMGVAHALRDHGYDTHRRSGDADRDVHRAGRPGGRRRDTGRRRRHEPAPRPRGRRTRRSGAGAGDRRHSPPRASSVVAAWASARRAGSTSPPHGGSPPASARGTTSAPSCRTAWSGTSRPRCSTTWRRSSRRARRPDAGPACLLVEERRVELTLGQDLDEVLDAEHLSQDAIGEHLGSIGYCERCAAVARILWPTKSETSMHVLTLGVDLVPRGQRSGEPGLRLVPAPVEGVGSTRGTSGS